MRNIMENGMEFYAFKFKDVLLIINSRPLVFPLVFSLSFSFVFGVRFIWGGEMIKRNQIFIICTSTSSQYLIASSNLLLFRLYFIWIVRGVIVRYTCVITTHKHFDVIVFVVVKEGTTATTTNRF